MQGIKQCFIVVWMQDSGQGKAWLYMWILGKRDNNYNFVSRSGWIITLKLKCERRYIIIGVYAPEEQKEEETSLFYHTARNNDKCNKNYSEMFVHDLIARDSSNPIPKVIGAYGEPANINQKWWKIKGICDLQRFKGNKWVFLGKRIFTNIPGCREVLDQL